MSRWSRSSACNIKALEELTHTLISGPAVQIGRLLADAAGLLNDIIVVYLKSSLIISELVCSVNCDQFESSLECISNLFVVVS